MLFFGGGQERRAQTVALCPACRYGGGDRSVTRIQPMARRKPAETSRLEKGQPLEVRYRAITELEPYARNARTHSDEQVAQIAASMREFGFTNPVLVDGKGGIIAGHGRVMAAKQIGLEHVPTIELGHLTEAQRQAYVIADNQLALKAGWSMELLRAEMESLGELGFELSLIGFNDGELAQLFLDVEEGETDPNEEWQGMPEFQSEDKTAFRSMPVHFRDQEAVDAFARLIGQQITAHTRFVWFPEIEIERYADKRYE